MKQLTQFLIGTSTLLALATGPVQAAGYGTGWYGEVQASLGFEDNIARTYLNDEQSDRISSLSFGGGYAANVGNGQLVLSGYFLSNRYRDTDALNNLGISLGAEYTFQPQLSYNAPWYSIRANVLDRNYADSRPREGLLVTAEISAHKRLSTELTGHLGYRYSDIAFNGKSAAEKNNDDAFDINANEVFIGIDYELRGGATIFSEYAYRQGDVLSTVSGGRRFDREYSADTEDRAFNPLCVGGCSYAYRQEGDTRLFNIGISYPYGGFNFDLTAHYFDASGDNGRDYEDWLVKVGWLWVF
jgi:opacity protein-like surface antigen